MTAIASHTGATYFPGDPGWDDARQAWNLAVDQQPAAVFVPQTPADIAEAIRFARSEGYRVALQGTGHGAAPLGSLDGTVLVRTQRMDAVEIDCARRRARAGSGAIWEQAVKPATEVGLTALHGSSPDVGIAGYSLGGGIGWLARRYGMATNSLTAVELVTADGEHVRVDAGHEPELFWGLRGGGGNFGIITSFEFALHPVGPTVLAGLIVHPLADAKDVLRFYREFAPNTPEELAVWAVMRKAPPLPFLPPEWHGKEILVLAACYSGDIADGERVLEPLRKFGRPIADVIGPQPFAAWQTILDPLLTPGMRNYWKSHDFLEVSDGLIDVLVDFAGRLPDAHTEIAFAQLGGAISRRPNGDTAYARRDAQYLMNVHGRWADAARDNAVVAWARSLFTAAAPFSTGSVYVNFLSTDDETRVRAAYGSNYDRLVALKNRYDPTNLFRVNQNIQPTAFSLPTRDSSEVRA